MGGHMNKNRLLKLLICFSLIICSFVATITVYAKDKNQNFTGNWQFVNSQTDVPCSGHVLLSYAKDTNKIFYGELASSENSKVSEGLNNVKLQIQDNTDKSFMLIQDGQQFYIQLGNGKYLKREGTLQDASLTETDDITSATAFRIEQTNFGTNSYSYFRIYEPYELTKLSFVVNDGKISLSPVSYSGFYIMAEATKIKEPPFGDFTKIARFIATMIALALIITTLILYRKNVMSIISFAISSICIIAFLVLFMAFAITSEVPGLYVLHKSSFNTEEVKPLENLEPPKSMYEIIADGSAIFSFEGEDGSPNIWQVQLDNDSAFTSTSSGKYTNNLYTIWLRPFEAGSYDVIFYYYDATQDISKAKNALKFHIEIDENKKITFVQPAAGEV